MIKGSVCEYVFAVDLGGTKCSAALVDKRGRIVRRREMPVDLTSPAGPVRQILELAKDLADRLPVGRSFSAAAVAVPGLVRPNGTVWAPNLPGWKRMPLVSRLRRLLGVPVVVESDRNAALIGECWRGTAQAKSDAVVLLIGTGIGAGILSGGRIIRGAHELSGCAGWLTMSGHTGDEASRLGEMESMCAGPAVARAAQKHLSEGRRSMLAKLDRETITAHDVANAARRGDKLAIEIFARMGTFLGYGVANLVSVLDPEIVVIGGGMAGAADLYIESLRKSMLSRAQPLAARKTKLAVSRLGNLANVLGCAHLAWEAARQIKPPRTIRIVST